MAFTRSRVRSPSAPQIRFPAKCRGNKLPFFVYILESKKDGTLYTGQTENLPARLVLHNKGLVKSTRSKRPYALVYFELFNTRTEAMRREWEFKKKWNTDRKRKLIHTFDPKKLHEISECEIPGRVNGPRLYES